MSGDHALVERLRRARLCEPALVRRTYRENFARHRKSLEESCRAVGAELHTFATDRPVIESLTRILRHRAIK